MVGIMSRSLCLLLLLLAVQSVILAQPQTPPLIVEGPPKRVEYFTGFKDDKVELPCRATGSPPLQYEWKRDMNAVDFSSTDDTGTLTIHTDQPTATSYEGVYQCFVHNGVGKAMSDTTRVVKSVQAQFPERSEGEYQRVRATIGKPLTLDCNPNQPSIPSPNFTHFSWKDKSGQKVWPITKRSRIDDEGNLHIAAVTQQDITETVWKCYIKNIELDVDAGGSETIIQTSGDPPVTNVKPSIMFYTNQTNNAGDRSVVVGLEGQTVSLRCFFSGRDVDIEWERDGSRLQAATRIMFPEHYSRLQIDDLQRSDEATYSCKGCNTECSDKFDIQLYVEAAPTFKSDGDRPYDKKANIGEDVVFRCNAYAIPEASIVWYKNAEPMDPAAQPSKFRFSDDQKTLTVSSVCKNDCGGPNDVMVIQCNASNTHGYVLGSGYINVFERTEIVVKPQDVTANFPDPVTFTVKATSDPDTPITYTWYHYQEPSTCDDNWCKVFNVSNETYITNENGSSLTILKTDETRLGIYRCEASNDVSSQNITVQLLGPPDLAYIWPYWWVILVIILLILIILLVILWVCCWMRRNRGDEYPVDEKERAADRDPEKELADSGFHDYQRQDAIWTTPGAGRAGPTGSLSSSVGKIGSDDEMSLNDYASLTPGKFTEDGSFIGQYNPAMKWKSSQSQPPPSYHHSHA